MRNNIMIDYDSERFPNQIQFSKPQSFVMPTEEEDVRKLLVNDTQTLAYGLREMINLMTPENKALVIEEVIRILKEE